MPLSPAIQTGPDKVAFLAVNAIEKSLSGRRVDSDRSLPGRPSHAAPAPSSAPAHLSLTWRVYSGDSMLSVWGLPKALAW